MCGIVGYIGKSRAVPYLLDGLARLEYRGYDSAGVAFFEDGKIEVVKAKGRLSELEKKLGEKGDCAATVGIGHTRWATHGEPNDVNAHPHLSESGTFAVVHNGIIENYAELKEELRSSGVRFSSETDTEVIAALLEKNYRGDFLEAVKKTTARLEGSYALAVLCSLEPKKIVCTRCQSPLVVGKGSDGLFLASDVTALLKHTRDVFKLSDGEIAFLEGGGLRFLSPDGAEEKKECEHISWSVEDAQKGGFEHFMLKEIFEQPFAFSNTVKSSAGRNRIHFDSLKISDDEIKKLNRIVITACGSAYHAGLVGKTALEKLTRIPTQVEIASEFRYCDPVIDENTLVVIISQSGETADTLAALRLSKEKGAHVLSIVNVVGSSIAAESENVVYTVAGPEIAVATTKAYSSQVAVLYLLSAFISKKRGLLSNGELSRFLSSLREIPGKISETLSRSKNEAELISKDLLSLEHAYFIGRSFDYAAAAEASLKLKEISYIHSEAYAAGELKHGTISLVEEGTLVVALVCSKKLFSKTVSNIREVKSRGARVLAVTTDSLREKLSDVDLVLSVPDCDELFVPSLEIVPLQLLAYYTALGRGCDVDKPRNLAKSVTVE